MQMWEVVELEKKESREEGKAEGKADSIIALLEEIDVVPESLKQTIFSQKDMEILNRWLKLAAKAVTIEEFMEKING